MTAGLSHYLGTVARVLEIKVICDQCGHAWQFLADEETSFAECQA